MDGFHRGRRARAAGPNRDASHLVGGPGAQRHVGRRSGLQLKGTAALPAGGGGAAPSTVELTSWTDNVTSAPTCLFAVHSSQFLTKPDS